ncbi:MAG: 5-formyltetrahydrofolate cyclo-ligase [Planctomycetota bacterium]|jgi:5-formyltetrahydrofolate cyclo-ligase
MDKAELRRKLHKCLIEMTEQHRSGKSEKACRNLIATSQFQQASAIMIFLSLPHEVDTSHAILNAWQFGKIVLVPKISWQQRHMIPVQINSLETGFATEAGGLRNPVTGVPMPISQIDLVVAPGLGFDKKGHRLGRGAAYYDRFFANPDLKAGRCGFAFAEQHVETIPVDQHDQPVDFLVTDQQVIYFKADGNRRQQGE